MTSFEVLNMTEKVKKIAITGACGNIGYSLIFPIAAGLFLGNKTPVSLHLLEHESMLPALKALQMELEDSCFPLLEEVKIGEDPFSVFESVDYAFLVGAKPRGPGMERKDLIFSNAEIFAEQGKALNRVASREVQVLVVGNPCNTNCLITIHNAPNIPPSSFHAMTRLDENRAKALLAKKLQVNQGEISNVIIWGNHSNTQVPDVSQAMVSGQKVLEKIADKAWLQGDFITSVQQRGAQIIKARGKSSAASAAYASIQAMQNLAFPTKEKTFFSSGTYTKDLSLPIDPDLVFSVPCIHKEGKIEPLSISWDPSLEERIRRTEKELIEERDMAFSFLGK